LPKVTVTAAPAKTRAPRKTTKASAAVAAKVKRAKKAVAKRV
jgi:hypothetical protein